jgi:hypothetical protein
MDPEIKKALYCCHDEHHVKWRGLWKTCSMVPGWIFYSCRALYFMSYFGKYFHKEQFDTHWNLFNLLKNQNM